MRTALATRFGSMPADVARDFAAAGGVAHQRGVLQIKRLDHGRKIVGIAVHVVPGGGLARPAMTAPVVRDHAEAVLREEKHLAVPGVGVQGPAVRERYDRALAPVLVIDFRAVLGGDRAHRKCSSIDRAELRRRRIANKAGGISGEAIKDRSRPWCCAKRPDVCKSSEYIEVGACHSLTFGRPNGCRTRRRGQISRA